MDSLRWFAKYREIILSVSFFVVLDAAVLVLNYYTTFQIAQDAHAIQLASEQATLSQLMLAQLHEVEQEAHIDFDSTETKVDRFAKTFAQFDEVLDSFIYGGELIGLGMENDKLLSIRDYSSEASRQLTEIEALWKPYRVYMQDVAYAYWKNLNHDELKEVIDEALLNAERLNPQFLVLLNDFSKAIETMAMQKAVDLRRIQTIGILLAITNFCIILFHFIRRLIRTDRKVEAAQNETREILENVNEGLFLLDNSYRIGTQYSASLHQMFKQKDLADKNFLELLITMVDKATQKVAEEYFDILFNERVKAHLVTDLNPLQQVKLAIGSEPGNVGFHYYRFAFNRVLVDNQLQHLLVTVTDITESAQLKEELKKADKKYHRELELMASLLHADSQLVNSFLISTHDNLEKINKVLQWPERSNEMLHHKAREIFKTTHFIKGEAGAIGFSAIEQNLHELENSLQKLIEKEDVSGNDFLPITVALNQLMLQVNNVQIMLDHFVEVRTQFAKTTHTQESLSTLPNSWQQMFENLVDTIAKDYGKKVRLDFSDFEMDLLPESLLELIKESCIQLLRNSVCHGIESPQDRLLKGKSETGLLSIRTLTDDRIKVVIRDDGRGINFQKIRNKAASDGRWSQEEVAKWPHSKLLKLLFLSGFTTADHVDKHSGRGIGLDAVKSRLDKIGASIAISTRTNAYTEIRIALPEQTPEFKPAQAWNA